MKLFEEQIQQKTTSKKLRLLDEMGFFPMYQQQSSTVFFPFLPVISI